MHLQSYILHRISSTCVLTGLFLLGAAGLQAAVTSSTETNNYFDDLSVAYSNSDLLQTDLDSSNISGFDPHASFPPTLPNGGNLYNGIPDSSIICEKYSRYGGAAYIDISTET